MRVAFIGVSHWHAPFYLEPVVGLEGVTVAGVSDPDLEVARSCAARLACPSFSDYRALCDRVRPDLVFALGRHCDMADEARVLIDAGIPFAMEKPCGLNAAEVDAIAERAAARGVFAAVPFVLRQSRLLAAIRERAGGETTQHLSFRFIAGTVSRYRQAGCDWMLDPAQSGGGCTLNLGVHFFDLCRILMDPTSLRIAAAVMSNAVARLPIEDYSTVVLRSDDGTCLIETGYIYPAPSSVFDMRFTIRTDRHYFIASGPDTLEAYDESGGRETLTLPTTNVPYYRDFVLDVIAQVKDHRPPLADLRDMAAVMRLVDAAYAMAGRGGAAPIRPERHPRGSGRSWLG